MSETTPETGQTDPKEEADIQTIFFRVVEWGAELPQHRDSDLGNLFFTNGVSAIEVGKNEKLVKCEVINTGKGGHKSVKCEDGQTRNVRHQLFAFQALLATVVDGRVEAAPVEEGELASDEDVITAVTDNTPSGIIIPGNNGGK